jgi:hypothetical protein
MTSGPGATAGRVGTDARADRRGACDRASLRGARPMAAHQLELRTLPHYML